MITLVTLVGQLSGTQMLITLATLIYMTIIMIVLKTLQYNREDDSVTQP